jgi:hypothetical protein
VKPPNGSWDSSRDQDAIIAQVAEDAARVIRSGNRRPQIAPTVKDRAPVDPPLHEGLLALIRKCPWWALLYTGVVIGMALNTRACAP